MPRVPADYRRGFKAVSEPETPSQDWSIVEKPSPDDFAPFVNLPIPVHSMGPDGMLRDVNHEWQTYTGFARSDAVGRSFADFLDASSSAIYRDKAVPELINTVPAGESRSVEYRLIKASGEVADIILTSRPQRDPLTGRFRHSLAVINDVSARNRAEFATRQTQRLEALGSLTGGVAHDFNNLLSVIIGSLELLSYRLPADDARSARLIESAMRGARRGAALTARLLAFGRQQELSPVPLAPLAFVGMVRPLIAQVLGPSVVIEDELPPGIWNVLADPNQLELALMNLAANARDAMPNGGHVRLSARNQTVDPAIDTSFIERRAVAAAGDYVVIAMSDTGIGMHEAELARAADPFFTTKGTGKGTGLGLSMVHGFAVQSGGTLKLSSKPGAGTTVELWLPRTTEASPAPRGCEGADQAKAAPAATGLRILLVDDDPLVLAGAGAMLEELGYTFGAAASGAEALSILRQDGNFDIIMTDYMMPGMSGTQLAAQARAMYPGVPILISSGYAELDKPIGTAWPRLRKPYNLAELSAALAAVRVPAL